MCGNVTFDHHHVNVPRGQWQNDRANMFRALCNPHGSTPCCYNNRCVDKSPDQCSCPDCYDIRRKLHADFATYVLDDPACSLTKYSTIGHVCRALKNIEITFIGDSLMDQLYLATILLLKGGEDALGITDPKCKGPLLYYPLCRRTVPGSVAGCNNTVRMAFYYNGDVVKIPETLNIVKSMLGKPQTVAVLGIGLHMDLNVEVINKSLIQPLLKLCHGAKWPKILWVNPMAPGLLKSPKFSKQNRKGVLFFNSEMKRLLMSGSNDNIAVVDTFAMTDDVVSYDGTHYGRALGEVKAGLLIQLIEGTRSRGWKKW